MQILVGYFFFFVDILEMQIKSEWKIARMGKVEVGKGWLMLKMGKNDVKKLIIWKERDSRNCMTWREG